MTFAPDGGWVSYSDYEKLESKYRDAEQWIKTLEARAEKLLSQRKDVEVELEEADRTAANWKRRAESADRGRDQAVERRRQIESKLGRANDAQRQAEDECSEAEDQKHKAIEAAADIRKQVLDEVGERLRGAMDDDDVLWAAVRAFLDALRDPKEPR